MSVRMMETFLSNGANRRLTLTLRGAYQRERGRGEATIHVRGRAFVVAS